MDLSPGLAPEILSELILLASLLDAVSLNEAVQETIRWQGLASREYSASSAYLLQFDGAILSGTASIIWMRWAPSCRMPMGQTGLGGSGPTLPSSLA